ncbi:hypothetical protein C9374_014667 [Naegleria lovaniensis]|uniref:F-box domain-containing protein n=1 Tax=Naegleria lovaniensis TaxID=51637 RepID=A0AA88GY75_NAELO|nr:uncharacterized protein C9374_014667 [Naegleria lovaniensis]KAG2389267.1 hypothetical protein C9374_014667 [Naegleria lovaniensis]
MKEEISLSDFAIQWLQQGLMISPQRRAGEEEVFVHHHHQQPSHHHHDDENLSHSHYYLSILEQLPLRIILKFCKYLSAFELEELLSRNNTQRGSCSFFTGKSRQFEIIIDECFERLFRKRFEEDERSTMAFKLQTKQDQLLLAASNAEDKPHRTETMNFIQLYFQNYLHQCVNSVLEKKQIYEFVSSDSQIMDETLEPIENNERQCAEVKEFLTSHENFEQQDIASKEKSFLYLKIPNQVTEAFFERVHCCKNGHSLKVQPSNNLNSLFSHLHRYGKYVRSLSISKSLLKYLREYEQLQLFMQCFERIEELTFRDMREEDAQPICLILQRFTSLQEVSFYHSFFSEYSLNAILNLIFSELENKRMEQKVSISHCFSDSIVQKFNTDAHAHNNSTIMQDCEDELDLYGDLFEPTSLEENFKKRPLSSVIMDVEQSSSTEESSNKKTKTVSNLHMRLTHITFRSVSFFQSSSELLGQLLSTHINSSLDSHLQENMLTLNFSFNELSSPMAKSLLISQNFHFVNLTTLILTENNVDNDFVIYLSEQKPLLKTLKKLDLSNNHIVGVNGVNALFEALQQEQSCLEFVNLSHNRLGGTSLFNDDYHAIGNCEIESLNVYISSFVDARLKTLLLSDCDLTPSMLQSLLLAMTHNKSITTLDISNNAMKTNALAIMLSHNTTLRNLSLSCCALEEISESLLKSLLNNESLNYLDLSGNRLKEAGGLSLVTYLKQKLDQCIRDKKILEWNTLDLSTNRFGEQFCRHLTAIFQVNHSQQVDALHIDTLLLENNFFSQEATQKLKKEALQSGMVAKIALTNEDGKAQVYVQPCDGTTLT